MRNRLLVAAICAVAVAFALSVHENPLSAWNPATCDFTTGGGFISPTASGAKGTFGVGGGCKNGSGTGIPPLPFFGHLEYHDHGDGTKVHGTKITGYLPDAVLRPDPYARLICGTARMGQTDVDFVVRVKDGGEPGTKDEFDIIVTVKGGGTVLYTTLQGMPHTLVGGNIQLHKPNKSNTGMFGGDCPALPPVSTGSFTLTVTLTSETGSGASGTVTSVPAGINCSVNGSGTQSGDCSASFPANQPVELTAIPGVGSSGTFDFGSCDAGDSTPMCTVTMNANRTVSATFRPSE
jgi:hypothetical protein